MPSLDNYKCNNRACDFRMPEGWGGNLYVVNGKGERVVCGHPGESSTIRGVIGKINPHYAAEMIRYRRIIFYGLGLRIRRVKAFLSGKEKPLDIRKVIAERTGFQSDCVCRRCLSQFKLDLRRDERICPECTSPLVSSANELRDKECPKCRRGTFMAISTGRLS